MSKNVAMFVDVANMYYAARGQDVDVDYVALLKHATKGRDLIRAYAYTGLDPENENQRKFIDFLGKNGYKPVVKDIRKFGDGRMKANLDIELVVDLFRLADRMDIAVIVSGDGDFAPAIKALQDKGVRAEVISFKPNTSSDLIAVADEFMDIMKIASISRKEGRAIREGMSTPEMPAKEVNPEFGFREASPSVAAAALAAIKGGGTGTRGTSTRGSGTSTRGGRAAGTRRSSTTAAAAATEAPDRVPAAPSAAEAIAESDEAARRRRRRRGGRGRGRSRRDEEGAEAVVGGDGEIGWEELDDLSQIDGLDEEREYSFSEADADTLAELGLTEEELAELTVGDGSPIAEGDADDAEDAVVAEEPPKRRRSARTAKPASDDAVTEAGAGEEAPKRRRSARTAKPASDDAGTEAGAGEEKPKRRRSTRASTADAPGDDATPNEEKPKRRRSSRAASGDAPEAPAPADASGEAAADAGTPSGDGEPQGIWGRFRTARGRRTTNGS